MTKPQIERFFLYGEPARPAGDRFVHLEFLDDRSRPANWIIRPHAHRDLHHIFFIETGGGSAEADGRRLEFSAPCIVVVPAGVVHGFFWRKDSAGRVLTFSASFLAAIAARDPGILSSFADGMWSAPMAHETWEGALSALGRELGWMAPGHELAVEAQMIAVLVHAMRANHEVKVTAPIGAKAMLVARLRERVEQSFRAQPSVEALAGALNVSVSTLRAACQEIAGRSPSEILHDRLSLEARRLMRYSNMSIAQIALYLGFSDAAYFSRFFSRETGQSPRAFKRDGASAAAALGSKNVPSKQPAAHRNGATPN